MTGLFRQLKRAFGIAPLTHAELELLADIADGRIHSSNWHYEHPPSLYRQLTAEGHIQFEPLRGDDGVAIGSPTALFGSLPIGTFRLSPAIPNDLLSIVERHRSNRGTTHKTVRRHRVERESMALRVLAVRPNARLAILWNLANDDHFEVFRTPVDMRLPESIDTPDDPIPYHPSRYISVTRDEQRAVVEELLALVDSAILFKASKQLFREQPLSLKEEWEVFGLDFHLKVRVVQHLAIADRFRSDPSVAQAQRVIRKADSTLLMLICNYRDADKRHSAIVKLFNRQRDDLTGLLDLDRSSRVRLAQELGIPVPPELCSRVSAIPPDT